VKTDVVFNGRVLDHHPQACFAKIVSPGMLFERRDPARDGFVQGLGNNLRRVLDASPALKTSDWLPFP
jgi:hypothetical protein